MYYLCQRGFFIRKVANTLNTCAFSVLGDYYQIKHYATATRNVLLYQNYVCDHSTPLIKRGKVLPPRPAGTLPYQEGNKRGF